MAKEKMANKWLYSDTDIRFAHSNKIMRLCINLMELFLLVLFLLQILLTTTANYAVIGVPTLLYIVGLVVGILRIAPQRSTDIHLFQFT